MRDVAAAAATAARVLAPDGVVVSIQNGLGGPDRARAVLGEGRVLVGVAGGFGAVLRGPGHVHHGGMEPDPARRAGGACDRARARHRGGLDGCRVPGARVRRRRDRRRVSSATPATPGTATLTGHTIGGIIGDPAAFAVALACAEETAATARARGVALTFDDVEAYVRAFGERIAGERPSMLLDLLAARRPGEIDAINGAIPAAAAAVGVAAPTNALVAQLVRARERVVLGYSGRGLSHRPSRSGAPRREDCGIGQAVPRAA